MSSKRIGVIAILLYQIFIWRPALCQDNTGNDIASLLLECYNNTALPGVILANERPPSTINLLVEYIRKLEDANPSMNARELSLYLMQRLRQDGIVWTNRDIDTRMGLPFTSSRLEIHKFRVLVKRLLPNPTQTVDHGDLTAIEKCALHYIISNTIDGFRRPNEATECSRTARYTSRYRRDVVKNPDAESIAPLTGSGTSSQQLNVNISQCPIELGVVYSQFGAVKTGDVLAGIAAGLNQQNIESVDNRYAATLVGELCEAALHQAPQNVSLGASGDWNSTINPKYLILQTNNNLQATDAELRGALDGLYMALKMNTWTSQYTDLKISQILDMYYSPFEKGVLDESVKACNRNILYTELISTETLNNQVRAFMPMLNLAAISRITFAANASAELSDSAVRALQSYLPRLATSDFSCTRTQFITRVATDLHIFIDTTWSYTTIQPLLSYILNNIDVNKFGTRYTLYGANTLSTFVNQTYFLSSFYTQYHQTVHSNETGGIDYIKVFKKIEEIGRAKLSNNSFSGGESTIFLIIPKSTPNNDQQDFISGRRSIINGFLPHIDILVMGSGQQSDYSSVVSNTERDVLIIQESTNEEQLKTSGKDMVTSIRSISRILVNPNCGSEFTGGSSTFSKVQYVELEGANYYRIPAQYFYNGGTKTLRIREQGYGSINICLSRDNSRPDNQTGVCSTASNTEYSVDISTYCEGNSLSSCSPIFLTVSGVSSLTKCTDAYCRFPNDIKFTISTDNSGCTSGSLVHTASAILIISLFFFSLF